MGTTSPVRTNSVTTPEVPLAIPNLAGNERRYLNECVDTNYVSSVGPFVGRFERMVGEATGAPHAVAVSSGTTAIHLALISVGVRPGDLVLSPSFTFIASINAISHAGASPWFVDVDEASWNLSPRELRLALETEARRDGDTILHRASGRRIGAILPVYCLGLPAEMHTIREIAEAWGLPIVADAAAAIGARYRGEEIGRLADVSTISFNGNKTVTCGGGGALVTEREDLARLAKHLATTARVGADYDHDRVGFNYRMTNVQAAIGCAQLEQLPTFLAAKSRIAHRYREQLGDLPGVSFPPTVAWAEGSNWLSGVVLDPPAPDVRPVTAKLKAAGIDARSFWKPIHLQLPYLQAPHRPLDVTDRIWPRVLTLPCSTSLTDDEQDFVIERTREAIRNG